MKKLFLLLALISSSISLANPTLRNVSDRTYATLTDCCSQIDADFAGTWTLLEEISSKVDTISCSGGGSSACDATPISSSTTITSAGSYCLSQNLSIASGNGITINADNVTLDLNGHAIVGSGGTDGVVVSVGSENVIIQNGIICSMAGNGISLAGNYCLVRDCDLIQNGTGITLQDTYGNILYQCTARENSYAGFSLISSFTNCVLECKALDNGSDASAFGFITNSGMGNLFEGCIADHTNSTATTTEYMAIGMALTGTEQYTKVINCKVDYTHTGTDPGAETAVPYGIYLEPTPFNMDNELISTPTQNNYDMAWSANGNYLAVSDSDTKLSLFSFANDTLTFVDSDQPTPTSGGIEIAWIGSDYIATAGAIGGTPSHNLAIYDSGLSLQATYIQGSGSLESPTWRDIQFLAVYDNSDTSMHIFEFDGSSLTHRNSVSMPNGTRIDWHNGADYIATVTLDISGAPTYVTTITVYFFDKFTYALSTVVTTTKSENQAHYASEISWSPDGNYLCCSGVDETGTAGSNVIIYQFDDKTPSLTEINTKFYTDGSTTSTATRQAWSPDSARIAISGNTNLSTSQQYAAAIYPRASSTPDLLLKPLASSDFYSLIAWSSQDYIALSTEDTNANTSQLSVFTQKNLAYCFFKNNVVCFTTGGNALGVGISGTTVLTDNMFIGNLAYQNDTNYQNVSNTATAFASSNPLANIFA